jgi:hypothetical protein
MCIVIARAQWRRRQRADDARRRGDNDDGDRDDKGDGASLLMPSAETLAAEEAVVERFDACE